MPLYMAPFPDSDSDVLGSKDQCCELKGLLLHVSLELVLFLTDQEFIFIEDPLSPKYMQLPRETLECDPVIVSIQKANKQSYKGTYFTVHF